MKREPLFKIGYRLSKMTLAEQCAELIALINDEPEDSTRRRELHAQLVDTRAQQIKHELKGLP